MHYNLIIKTKLSKYARDRWRFNSFESIYYYYNNNILSVIIVLLRSCISTVRLLRSVLTTDKPRLSLKAIYTIWVLNKLLGEGIDLFLLIDEEL